jgi:hypothetical protein
MELEPVAFFLWGFAEGSERAKLKEKENNNFLNNSYRNCFSAQSPSQPHHIPSNS